MAPARRLRSLFARFLRYVADAVQPPAGVPAAEPLPTAAAGNEHWLAVVRERAPELLTGGGIHAGVSSPDHPAGPSPHWLPPASPTDTPRSRPRAYIAKHQDGSRRPLRAPTFATLRALRRKFRPARRRTPKPAVHEPQQFAVSETVSTGSAPASHPEISGPTTSRRPPAAAGFDAPRPRAAMADAGDGYPANGGRGRTREPVRRFAVWPATPVPSATAPEFDNNDLRPYAALDEWPPLRAANKTLPVQPDFTPPVAQVPESPAWPEERRDDERWPELPDDEILWQPPASVFDSDNVKRLDDEQRGW